MHRGYLPPWLLQSLGILILIGATIYWVKSGHQSALLVGAAMALIGLGAYSGIRVSISQEIDQQKLDEHKKSEEIAHDVEYLGSGDEGSEGQKK